MRSWVALAVVVALGSIGALFYVAHPKLEAALPSPTLQPTAERPRTRRGGMDVTFIVTADLHFGFQVPADAGPRSVDEALGIERHHLTAIHEMNTIVGKPYPEAIGGQVGEPLGVLVAGDLTEDGKPREWARFEQYFGLTGRDALVRYPVFEGIGNHDKHYGWYVKEQIARRHGANRYSWDWQDLHLVCLGEAPDEADIAWLRDDLADLGDGIGIVLYFHFPLEGPFSRGHWFGDGNHKDELRRALDGNNVLGIFHGHFHGTGPYRWHDLEIFNVGSAKHGYRSFSVVHVTHDRMTVAEYNYVEKRWWWWRDKRRTGEAREWRSPGDGIVGPNGWPSRSE